MRVKKTRYKSRQVNLDKYPYVNGFGNRATGYEGYAGPEFTHNPRVEFEATRDPYPMVGKDGNRYLYSPGRIGKWAPRRDEYDTPVNRVLAFIRPDWERCTPAEWLDALELSPEGFYDLGYTDDEIDHAKKILERLADWKTDE